MKRTMYIKKTSREQLAEKWGFKPSIKAQHEPIYITCTKEGVVNWEKNRIIFPIDIIEYSVIKGRKLKIIE